MALLIYFCYVPPVVIHCVLQLALLHFPILQAAPNFPNPRFHRFRIYCLHYGSLPVQLLFAKHNGHVYNQPSMGHSSPLPSTSRPLGSLRGDQSNNNHAASMRQGLDESFHV